MNRYGCCPILETPAGGLVSCARCSIGDVLYISFNALKFFSLCVSLLEYNPQSTPPMAVKLSGRLICHVECPWTRSLGQALHPGRYAIPAAVIACLRMTDVVYGDGQWCALDLLVFRDPGGGGGVPRRYMPIAIRTSMPFYGHSLRRSMRLRRSGT